MLCKTKMTNEKVKNLNLNKAKKVKIVFFKIELQFLLFYF